MAFLLNDSRLGLGFGRAATHALGGYVELECTPLRGSSEAVEEGYKPRMAKADTEPFLPRCSDVMRYSNVGCTGGSKHISL